MAVGGGRTEDALKAKIPPKSPHSLPLSPATHCPPVYQGTRSEIPILYTPLPIPSVCVCVCAGSPNICIKCAVVKYTLVQILLKP